MDEAAGDGHGRSNSNSASTKPLYEVAKRTLLPSQQFHLVEYPGVIESVDAAIETLGGTENMEKVGYSKQQAAACRCN